MPAWLIGLFKWVGQALLVPLVMDWWKSIQEKRARNAESKRLEEEAKKKAQAHAQSTVEQSTDTFGDLPCWAILVPLAMLLTGCNTTRILITEQCSPAFAYVEAEVLVEGGGLEKRQFIDTEKSRCNCRPYEFSRSKVGPRSANPEVKPLEYCDRLVGFPVKVYPKVQRFWDDVRQDIVSGDDKKQGD